MTLRTRGSEIVDAGGDAIRLKGVNIGGWLNMENFITGYAANETMMRSAVRNVLGDDAYELFFERLLSAFYADADAAFLAETDLNCVRIPVNYRHLESDARPFEIIGDGFRHLDRAIAAGGSTASTRSSTCTRCRDRRTSTGTRTTRRTARCSGSTGTSRTGWSASGRRSPTATRATPGSRATT